MLKSIKIIAEISVSTSKFQIYNDNGKAKLTPFKDQPQEALSFGFDKDGLEQILFRDKGSSLNVNDKIMGFVTDKGKFSIYFRSGDIYWMIKDPEPFMNDCREAYNKIIMANMIMNGDKDDNDYMTGFYSDIDLPDEFDDLDE